MNSSTKWRAEERLNFGLLHRYGRLSGASIGGSKLVASGSLTVGVLAVQGDVREHLNVLTRLGVKTGTVRRPDELSTVDALVIPGGESTTMSRLLLSADLIEPLRDRIASGMPVLGSCAGMIMLATEVLDGRPDQQQLGGLDITVRRNAFGRQVDSFERNISMTTIGDEPLRAVFIRAPKVERVGDNVEVLATITVDQQSANEHNAGAEAAIVAVRSGVNMATAFHPELSGDDRIHCLFVDTIRQS